MRRGVRGVDADLVVKPFGWKGTLADLDDFAAEALQVHLGIQSDVLLASASRDVVGGGERCPRSRRRRRPR